MNGLFRWATIAVAVGLSLPGSALASFDTEVLSALESDKALPDVHLGVGFDRRMKRARITREWIQTDGMTRQASDVRELTFTEVEQRLLIDLRVGLFRDLELHVQAPIVLNLDSRIEFADGVSDQNSTIFGPNINADDPTTDFRYPITGVPAGRNRAGFGDMTFGLSWSPLVDEKDPSFPTLTFRTDVIAPTGPIRNPQEQKAIEGLRGVGDVGRSAVTFDLSMAVSRRMGSDAPYMDPYVLVGTQLPVAVGSLRDQGYEPPPSGRLKVGTEVVIEEKGRDEFYSIDLAFGVRYVARGRTFSELSDYLPNFDQTNVDRDATYADYADPSNYASTGSGAQCGITEGVTCGELNKVDPHLDLMGTLAVIIQPSKWVRFRFGVEAMFTTPHILTGEPVGDDTDNPATGPDFAGRVNARNANGFDERSPYHDPRYDAVGRRLRAEQIFTLRPFLNVFLTF